MWMSMSMQMWMWMCGYLSHSRFRSLSFVLQPFLQSLQSAIISPHHTLSPPPSHPLSPSFASININIRIPLHLIHNPISLIHAHCPPRISHLSPLQLFFAIVALSYLVHLIAEIDRVCDHDIVSVILRVSQKRTDGFLLALDISSLIDFSPGRCDLRAVPSL
ncbi:hypothetical protein BC939DRAFT_450892 [Gamsiella multidivaricata]|uniref:uncharacterized protein n=1 Tax=Gamsiella multidivaricata TaxID=101098 RepID=UPI00221EBB23|nr:uncharacterized protein BC939DRAFT_450892 [Gamsiella multidivaricata]KAI7823813.1 hypothetical protein BC939DRAFT_450892 [Gamsiella multidivaricata]